MVGGGLIITIVCLVWERYWDPGWTLDLQVYRAGGTAWAHGFPLYAAHFARPVSGPDFPFTYPPIAAVIFSVLSVVPLPVAIAVVLVLNLAALITLCLMAASRQYGWGTLALVVGLAVAGGSVLLEPVRETLGFGQVNVVLGMLVAADCLLPRTRWPRGLLIGLAAAIKLTPVFFVLFFLPRRQWRPVLTAAASFVGFGLLGLALAPSDTRAYWFGALLDLSRVGRVGYASNQSLLGVLDRLALPRTVITSLWVVLSLAMVVLAWIVVLRARRAGEELTALLAVAAAELVVSPISWEHHWVWIAPALLLLTSPAWRRRKLLLVVVVFTTGPPWWLPSGNGVEQHWTWWQQLIGNSYVLTGVLFVVLAAFVIRWPASEEPASAPASSSSSVTSRG